MKGEQEPPTGSECERVSAFFRGYTCVWPQAYMPPDNEMLAIVRFFEAARMGRPVEMEKQAAYILRANGVADNDVLWDGLDYFGRLGKHATGESMERLYELNHIVQKVVHAILAQRRIMKTESPGDAASAGFELAQHIADFKAPLRWPNILAIKRYQAARAKGGTTVHELAEERIGWWVEAYRTLGATELTDKAKFEAIAADLFERAEQTERAEAGIVTLAENRRVPVHVGINCGNPFKPDTIRRAVKKSFKNS